MSRVLVVGATESTSNVLRRASKNLQCEFLFSEPNGRSLARHMQERPDLAILDITAAELDVPQLCAWLRKEYSDLLVMVLSQVGEKFPKELCINVHLVQPFTSRKLGNRIKKLLDMRRKQPLTVGPFTLDPDKRRIIHGKAITRLTPKEYRLLEFLMLNAGKALSRKQIMKEVWDTDYLGDTRTLDVHMRWLREKLEEEPGRPRYLRTIRRVGYIFDPAGLSPERRETAR